MADRAGLLVLLAGPPLAVFVRALIGDVRQRREVQPAGYERACEVAVGRYLHEHRRLRVEGPFECRLQVCRGVDPERFQAERLAEILEVGLYGVPSGRLNSVPMMRSVALR